MSRPASGKPPSNPPGAPERPPPVTPSAEGWRAMSRAERDAFIEMVNEHFSDPALVMSEGRPHKRAKTRALDELTLHFSSTGRSLYLADEMSVLYPGEDTFVPDILGVLGVETPAEDERQAWVVQEEGRGLDLVIEVLHRGDRNKDLVRNVEWYARLGIGEYFVYDRARRRLHGYQLPTPGARRYREIAPRLGRLSSQVLGLDLALVEGQLRFFSGYAELGGSPELIAKLSGMMDRAEVRIAELEARAGEAEARAGEAEARAGEAEARAGEAEARARALATALRRGVLLLLRARGLAAPPEVIARIEACQDAAVLQRWLDRAAEATDAAAAVAEEQVP